MAFRIKDRYDVNDLCEIVKYLRSENGCPWDKVQTHETIRSNLIEETYEVLEALDNRDTENLREELGDLLLQVVFHSELENEVGHFDFDEVVNEVCQKLVVRHPHVFGGVSANTIDAALETWNGVKEKTKERRTTLDSINSIPRSLPALIRAEKIQRKAASRGFDWQEVGGAVDKIEEELAEVREAIAEGDSTHIDEELGDLIFATVNAARFTNTDPEAALTFASDKFVKRFVICERLADERGMDMKQCTLEQLNALWDEAKELTRTENGK